VAKCIFFVSPSDVVYQVYFPLVGSATEFDSAFHLQELRFRIIGGDKECMDLVKELAQKVPANAESVSK
jgi:hypothetical protein